MSSRSKSGQGSTGKKFRATAIHGQVNANQAQDTSRIFNEQILPTVQRQKGFIDALQLHDTQTGETIAITLWETDQALQQATSNRELQDQLDQLRMAMGGAQQKTYDATRT